MSHAGVQAVYNGNAFRFSTSTGASLSFIRTVQEMTSLPQAIIYINRVWDSNFTLVVPTGRRDLLESNGIEHVPAATAAVAVSTASTPVCYFNYTVKIWTTDIAPLATAAQVVTTLKSRLDTSLVNDVFGLRLRQNTYIYGDSRLAVRSATTDSSLVSTVALSFSRVEHSAKPTSQPSRQPSSQPSRQPTTTPTSMPSFLKQTNWLIRLREELQNRFDKRDRANRAMYFQLDLANTTYFSSPAQYASFMYEITRRMAIYQRLKVVTLLAGNESSGAMVEYKCDEDDALRSLREAFQLNDRNTNAISCNGAIWRTKYCSATDTVPTLCINCVDPCREPCYREPVTRISTVLAPTPYNCSIFYGTLKVLHVEGYQPEINPDYVASSLGALWVVMVMIVVMMVVYHRYLIVFRLPTGFDPHEIDDDMAAVSTWDAEKALAGRWSAATGTRPRPGGTGVADPRNDMDHRSKIALIQTLNDDIFGLFHLYHSTMGRWIHALVYNHRILRIFNNFLEEGWNIFWFATSLAAYGLLIASMMEAQYPYDDGQCASLTTKASCESYRSQFIDHRYTCTWHNDFTTAQETLLGDLLDYQTNCVFNIKEVPSSDVFRLSLLGVLFVSFCRLTLLEPFVKRFLMPPLITTTPTTVMEMEVLDEKGDSGSGEGGGARMIITPAAEKGGFSSSVRRLQRTDSTMSSLGVGGSRVSLKNNAVQPQQMQDFMLEIHFPAPNETPDRSHTRDRGHGHDRGGASRQSALMQVNLVPRKEIDEGLKTLANAHVFDMETDNLYKYEIEIRPTATTASTAAVKKSTTISTSKETANDDDAASSVWRRLFNRLWWTSRDTAANGSSSGVTIVHRAPEQFRDEEFRQFYGHLMAHRVTFLPADTYQWRFDYHWGLQDGHFHPDRVLHRSFTWQAQHHFQVHQAAGDYFHEYINHVSHVAATERVEATHHPTSLPLRILLLFVLDVMGHFSVEAGLLRRRLYRRINPRAAVSWWLKGLAILTLCGINTVLLLYTWETVKYFPQSHLHNWFRALIIAVVVDFFFVENIDNAWCHYVVPSTCLAAFHYAKDEVIRLILQTNFVAPSRGTAASTTTAATSPYGRRVPTDGGGGGGGGGASVASGISSAMRPLRPSGSAMSLVSRSMGMGMPARTNSASSLMSLAQQRPFDTPDYFFVSRKFARLFPSFAESQLVLQYHTDLPRRIKVGTWRRNTDVDVEHVSLLEPLFPCVGWCLQLFRDHDEAHVVDDQASLDTDEQRRQQIQRQRALEERRRELREEVTWGDRLYARWVMEQARWRDFIVYLGSMSTMSQRLAIHWLFLGLLFLLWWLLPQIEFMYFWYAAVAIFGVALLVSVTLCGYYHSFFIRDMLDEAQYLSWLHCFGVAPTEYPPQDPLAIDDVPDDEWELIAATAAAAAAEAAGGSRGGGGPRDDASDVSSLSDGDGVRPMRTTHDIATAVPFTPSRGRLGSPAKRSNPSSAASSQQQPQHRHRQGTAETSPGTVQRPAFTAAYADDDANAGERHSPSAPPSGAAQPWSIDWQRIPTATSFQSAPSSAAAATADGAGVVRRTLPVVGFHDTPQYYHASHAMDTSDSDHSVDHRPRRSHDSYDHATNGEDDDDVVGGRNASTPRGSGGGRVSETRRSVPNIDRLLVATVASSLKAQTKKTTGSTSGKVSPNRRGSGLRGSMTSSLLSQSLGGGESKKAPATRTKTKAAVPRQRRRRGPPADGSSSTTTTTPSRAARSAPRKRGTLQDLEEGDGYDDYDDDLTGGGSYVSSDYDDGDDYGYDEDSGAGGSYYDSGDEAYY